MEASDDLPKNVRDWNALVKRENLTSKSIHGGEYQASGSKISLKQFLLLRVLWKVKKFKLNKDWPDASSREDASDFLNEETTDDDSPWLHYLESIKQNTTRRSKGKLRKLGNFKFARQYQLAINSMPPDTDGQLPPKIVFHSIETRSVTAAKRAEAEATAKAEAEETLAAKYGISVKMMRDIHLEDQRQEKQAGPPATPTRSAPGAGLFIEDMAGYSSTPQALLSASTVQSATTPFTPHEPTTAEEARYMAPDKDEQITNTALLVFLDALTIDCDEVHGEWSPHRYPFSFNGGIYTAMVDGYFQNDNGVICAILEVKAGIRYGSTKNVIKMQEGAEMAAWISQYPPKFTKEDRKKKRVFERLLISQDRHEIYLNIGHFGPEYVDFTQGKDFGKKQPFLTMEQYGPYNVTSASNMAKVGEMLLAFAMKEML